MTIMIRRNMKSKPSLVSRFVIRSNGSSFAAGAAVQILLVPFYSYTKLTFSFRKPQYSVKLINQ